MATDIMIVSIDEEKPQLFKIDPAGFYFGYKATASGEKINQAVSLLDKTVGKDASLSFDEAVQAAIMTLQETVSSDFQSNAIEVGVVEKPGDSFRRLSIDEIDRHLDAIKERD